MRWDPYVPVRQRRANGLRKAQRAIGKGGKLQPISIEGRKIAKTFWGKSWCTHLEDFSDFANRLPRGRTYARNGSIVHLEISTGEIAAMVAGRELYQIKIKIDKMSAQAWNRLCNQCGSSISSTIDLLRGKLPEPVLELLTDPDNDLFPHSNEIELSCNCPDWAYLCKHLAAVLYGVGSRLDDSPELLFKLRGVDPNDLIGDALLRATDPNPALQGAAQLEANNDLEDIFGIELVDISSQSTNTPVSKPAAKSAARIKKSTKRKAVKKKPVKKTVVRKVKKKATNQKTTATKKKTARTAKKKAKSPTKKKAKRSTKKQVTKKKATKKKSSPTTASTIKKKAKSKAAQSKARVTKKAAKKKKTTSTRRKKK